MKPFFFVLFVASALLTAFSAFADPRPAGAIEILADQDMVWQRDQGTYTARGNVRIVTDDLELSCDELTAQTAVNGNKTDIKTLTATGTAIHAKALKDGSTVTGAQTAVHNVDTGTIVFTGNALKLVNDKFTLTAKDKLTYNQDSGQAAAYGDVVAIETETGRKLRADQLTTTSQNGALKTLDAKGHVFITTSDGIASGDSGTYNTSSGEAILTGNVKLTRGDNQASAQKAVIDMQSGETRLISDGASGQRVRALILPEGD